MSVHVVAHRAPVSEARQSKKAIGQPRTPHIRWVHEVAIARVRYGSNRRLDVPIPSAKSQAQAEARALILAQLAFRMRKAKVDEHKLRELLKLAGVAAIERDLLGAIVSVERITGGPWKLAGVPTSPTIKSVGDRWTSGELARLYPDQVGAKSSSDRDARRLDKYVYPVVGNVPIDRFELDDAERVMRGLPATLKPGTRKQIGSLLSRIMTLSVYPLRLREHSPIPKGFLPKGSKPRAMNYLFPAEDARLLACTRVDLAFRMLDGWLTREGMRVSEALAMSPSDIDFERGRIRLDENKTDDPRSWVLADGSARALRLYIDRFRPGIGPNDPIFVAPDGKPFTEAVLKKLARKFRMHLRWAGIERPELFEATAARMKIRIHDLRGTFVTLSLAAGRTESWVSDRTGHKDWRVMRRYKRPARELAELTERAGTLVALDLAVPELRDATGDGETPPAAPGGRSRPASPTRSRTAKSKRPRRGAPREPGHRMATGADEQPLATAAIASKKLQKPAARKASVGVERRSRSARQYAAETADSRGNDACGSVQIDAHGQPVASFAPHGGVTPVTPADARASLEHALAAALARATEASTTHAGGWDAMREVARAIQVALATAPATDGTHEVVELDAARRRRPR